MSTVPTSKRRAQRRWGVRVRQALLPGERWLDDACILGTDERIDQAIPWKQARRTAALPLDAPVEDLGEVALLPGLINAHAHLELGGLRNRIPPGTAFPAWLRALVAATRPLAPEDFTRAVREGLDELRSGGCAFVADIVRRVPPPHPGGAERPCFGNAQRKFTHARPENASLAPNGSRSPFPQARLYLELIAFDPARAEQAVAEAERLADDHADAIAQTRTPAPRDEVCRAEARFDAGLSPHAPYTTTLPLLTHAVCVAVRRGWPLCIHAAETDDERRLWLRGDGPLRDFLDEFDLLPPTWQAPGCSPVVWLERAGVLAPPSASLAAASPRARAASPDSPSRRRRGPPTLLVHLNAIDDDDLALLARRRATVAAAVCPGTHRYFGRGPFPFERLRRAGVPTALGTDGLSSNDRLSMWEEIRRAGDLAPTATAAQLVDAATATAARALGIAHAFGAIAPGRRAVFCLVRTDEPAPDLHTPAARDWLATPRATTLHLPPPLRRK